ncbi:MULTISPECIES: hypothetical protein [Staphylococcus]|uniref:hypothetical protein n=1 Tax=Staphylococcus TaxID=1279 RepID=UPI001643B86A|nr:MULTISPECIES: hypothetical protein [Staphylococcus]MCI2788761.1 hypothetical protein [Staphylococcus warneri]MEB7758502.1 hypothetical protein [Staphylococcus equorum]MEB7760373.1 hypothetical protein [Staphylococcus equorum]
MKIFIGMIASSVIVSTGVGMYTEDIFNALALYTPLSLISVLAQKSLEDRKVKKILEGK